jgi:hypothetical protein
MLQRVQSIWLLLAAAFAAVTFKFPFYSGNMVVDPAINSTAFTNLNATTTIWLSILTALTGVVAFVTIFLFDNRKLQLKLCYLGIFLTVVLLVMYFMELRRFITGNIGFLYTGGKRDLEG